MRRAVSRSSLAASSLVSSLCVGVLGGALGGCSQTLTEADCQRYRDRLQTWASAKGGPHGASPRPAIPPEAGLDAGAEQDANDFMKSCNGISVSRFAARCLERAADEAAFFRCLE